MSKNLVDMTDVAEMNNISAKNTVLRDAFLEGQAEYLKELKQKPSFIKNVRQLQNEFTATQLNKFANAIMDDIENCKVKPKELEAYEYAMVCALAAIVDYQKVPNPERTH